VKLRWVKINCGLWVDREACYCIRWRPAGCHDFIDIDGDAFEAREMFPGCPVETVAAAASLPAAKAACQEHYDELFSEEAA